MNTDISTIAQRIYNRMVASESEILPDCDADDLVLWEYDLEEVEDIADDPCVREMDESADLLIGILEYWNLPELQPNDVAYLNSCIPECSVPVTNARGETFQPGDRVFNTSYPGRVRCGIALKTFVDRDGQSLIIAEIGDARSQYGYVRCVYVPDALHRDDF